MSTNMPNVVSEARVAMRTGILIAVCGIDGSGKSSLIQRMQSHLSNQNRSVETTKQPTDAFRKSRERADYIAHGSTAIWPETLALLAAADVLQHLKNEVFPAMDLGKIVISDRYILGARAAFLSRGVQREWFESLNQFCPTPHLTIILDCPGDIAMCRIRMRGNLNDDEEDTATLERKRQLLLALADTTDVIIDARQPEEAVFAQCIGHVEMLLNQSW